jgi:hypothetical protein
MELGDNGILHSLEVIAYIHTLIGACGSPPFVLPILFFG